jgi:hypothetical protein
VEQNGHIAQQGKHAILWRWRLSVLYKTARVARRCKKCCSGNLNYRAAVRSPRRAG